VCEFVIAKCDIETFKNKISENLIGLIYDLGNTIFTQLARSFSSHKQCGPLLLNILRPGYS